MPSYEDYLKDLVTRLTDIWKLAHDHLVKTKERSKECYDNKLNPQSIEVGSFVFLQSSPKLHQLDDQYAGPHQVLGIIPKNNVKIEYKKRTQTVHMNRLKIDENQLRP